MSTSNAVSARGIALPYANLWGTGNVRKGSRATIVAPNYYLSQLLFRM